MIKLQIAVPIKMTGEVLPLEIELVDQCITEELFKEGHEKDLESQKTFISCLIWGSVGFNVSAPIDNTDITCKIEFDNGYLVDVPREILYDIKRLIGA